MLAAIGVAGIAALSFASAASAITVTSTGESGACTLRIAIQAAAAHDDNAGCGQTGSGTVPINLAANTYTPTDGQIVVPGGANISINGDNVNNPLTTVIDGTGGVVSRLFEISSGASVTFSGLTLTGGRTPDSPVSGTRHLIVPVPPGGAIWNKGSLTFDHSVVTGNRTGDGSDGTAPALEDSGGSGGTGGDGGAIFNNDGASLTVTNSKISDNSTGNGGDGAPGGMGVNGIGHFPSGSAGGNGGYGGSGGGIYNSNTGSLSIDKSTISGNDVGRGGSGGQGGQGAGPAPAPGGGEFSGGTGGDGGDGGNGGKAYRKDQGNYWDYALGGGGVYSLGTANITNTTVNGNTTGAGGNGGTSGAGGPTNTGSGTFRTSGRAGTGGGGGRGAGLLNGGTTATMNLTNVTITGNLSGDGGQGGGGGGGADSSLGGAVGGYGGDGGGLWAQGAHGETAILTHVTITKNFLGGAGPAGTSPNAFTGGPGDRGKGAGVAAGNRYDPGGAGVYLRKTLISANGFSGNPTFDKNCAQYQPIANYQEFVDQGYNLSYPNDGSPCPGLTNVDPDLGNLGNFGGPTQTIVPQPGSAAIGGVPLAQCAVTTDQRGFPRPGADGTSCDIGAVETGVGPSTTPTTTSLNSSKNPSTTGEQVTYTATVSPPPSSGTISVKDGGVVIPGCEALSQTGGGQVTCSVTYPVIGDHSIVAGYTGNSLFDPSTSTALSQSVNNGTLPDTTPPDTLIDSGPSGTIFVNTATFTFHGTPGDTARTQCKIDTEAFAECNSPKTYAGLSDGTHTFNVRAVDAIGNADATPAVGVFKVDTSEGEPVKTTAGKPKTTGTTAIVPFTCTGAAGLSCVIKANLSTVLSGAGNTSAPFSLRAKGKKKGKKKVTVGGAKATIPAGSTKKVSIKLNGKGKKLLKKIHKIRTTLTVSQQVDGSYKEVLAKSITFKARKKKKRRR